MEYVVDAHGCRPADIRSQAHLSSLMQSILTGRPLRPVADPVWHVFPGEGGVTGIVLLAESHLTIHTYPE